MVCENNQVVHILVSFFVVLGKKISVTVMDIPGKKREFLLSREGLDA